MISAAGRRRPNEPTTCPTGRQELPLHGGGRDVFLAGQPDRPGGELALGMSPLAGERGDRDAGLLGPLRQVRRRRAEGARDQHDPVGEGKVEQLGDDAGVGVHGRHVPAPVRRCLHPRRDPVLRHQLLDEADVLLRDLRAQAGDQVVGVACRDLGRDHQVDAVRPPADPLLDPGQLRVELLRAVRRGREDAESAGLGHLGHDRRRAVEADQRMLNADQIGEGRSHAFTTRRRRRRAPRPTPPRCAGD